MRPIGLLVAGVAGQGVEKAGRLIATAALRAGLEVRLALARAPSHAAGSVLCQLRIADGGLATPFLREGEADLLLALDRLEALRHVHELRRDGLLIVADRLEPTPRMRAGLDRPPADLLPRLCAHVARVVEVGAAALARELRLPAAAGVAILGVAAPFLPIPDAAWEQALREQFDAAELPACKAALASGREIAAALLAEGPLALPEPSAPRPPAAPRAT